jgi:cell wall-associated NlpC family hydrolase
MWQDRGIKLPDEPRDDEWWDKGGDLFMKGFRKVGAREVSGPRLPGDVVLMSIASAGVVNHCAYVRENGLILHHLRKRLSNEEPLGRWEGHIVKHLRYVG